MVYCGKLSKACQPCRKRRLMCDLRKEGCSQCRRAQQACTGYQDTTAIRIRDETGTIQRKFTRRNSAARPTVQSLDLSLCHQAKEIFYQNYVVGETKCYSFMRQYYSPDIQDEHLIKSIDAVSLAYLNYQKRTECAQSEARLHYIDALRLTSNALQSPELAARDSTMLSILLLDLYEKITSTEPQYDGAWAAHIKGALSLVQLRGHEQYRNPDGLRMLVRLSTNILISCVAGDRAVPEEVVALRAAVISPFSEPSNSDPKWRETELMVEYARLKNQIKHNLLSDGEIVRAAMDLDTQFLSLSQQLTSSWNPETVYVDGKSAHHYEAYHYIYSDEHIGKMWNVFRITRILLCELILPHCAKLPINPTSNSGQSSVECYATSTIDKMSREICATVPQYIGGLSDPFSKEPSPTGSPPKAPIPDTRVSLAPQPHAKQHVPCYRLIFPLYVAAQSPSASNAIKQYAIRQLHLMAEYHGIENALAVAKILESGEKRNPWNVFALLGSYAFVC